MVDYRFSLLRNIKSNSISVSDFLEMSNMTIQEFNEEFEQLSNVIEELYYEKVFIKDHSIVLPNTFNERWLDIYIGKNCMTELIQEDQRKSMIYIMAFMSAEELSVYHFQSVLEVSKNTILKDIKSLRADLSEHNVKFLYSRKKGFYISGDELEVRSLAFAALNILITDSRGKGLIYEYLYELNDKLYNNIRFNLSKIQKEFNLIVVPSRFEEMSYFLSVLLPRIKYSNYELKINEHDFISSLSMYRTVKEFVRLFSIEFKLEDIYYVTILFMICTQGDLSDSSLDFLMDCCSEIIYEMERLAVIHFKNFKKILVELFYHLVPSYFRIMYNLSIDNALINEIKIQYEELYHLTRKSLSPLENLTKKYVPKEEVGYYTILFGGEILSQKEQEIDRLLEAVIVCPSGISSSVIMKSELKKLFPSINFRETTSIKNFNNNNLEKNVDIIFSSVPIKSHKKVYVINPIMSQLEKSLLIRSVQEDFYLRENLTPSINELLDIIIPYIELKKGVTRESLYNLLQNKINKTIVKKEDNRPMLSELLTEDMIQLVDTQENWEDAISFAASPLKQKGMVNENYIEAMIKKVKDYGPFINIGQYVALPHARPEDGVKELGMSLLKVKTPVLLCDDEKHPIKLFICLAAVDNETHLRALASLTKILSNKEKLEKLLQATTKKEIMDIIIEGEDE